MIKVENIIFIKLLPLCEDDQKPTATLSSIGNYQLLGWYIADCRYAQSHALITVTTTNQKARLRFQVSKHKISDKHH